MYVLLMSQECTICCLISRVLDATFSEGDAMQRDIEEPSDHKMLILGDEYDYSLYSDFDNITDGNSQ